MGEGPVVDLSLVLERGQIRFPEIQGTVDISHPVADQGIFGVHTGNAAVSSNLQVEESTVHHWKHIEAKVNSQTSGHKRFQ